MEFNTVTRKQIPLCEYHELDEGWKTKLGGIALAAAMAFNAMNPSKVDNNEVFVYMDTVGKTHTVTQMNDIPSDAQFKFKINTTAKDVAALDKSGKEIPVEVEPSSPEQFTPEVDTNVLKSVVDDDPMISKYSIDGNTITLHLRITDNNLNGYIQYSKNVRKLITAAGALEYFGFDAAYKKQLLQKLPGIKNIEFKHNL
jgi:hypothetical protein|tara:strand:- start:120 stop:716 length:597 start_codon:yes stop_codon:yes gene_type:complete